MSVTMEQLKQIEPLGIKKHVQIVDGYIASGLLIDDITIHYAVDQGTISTILHSYGFGLGSDFGDDFDSIKKYKGVPFHLIEQYVSTYFPGLLNESSEHADINLDSYLNIYQPNWRMISGQSKHNLFGLSEQELEGKAPYIEPKKPSNKKGLLGKLINKSKL